MQWEALRDAYGERFGTLFDAREVEDEHGRRPPFWVLVFWEPEVPGAPVVYASFGAPGREVYVVSAAPIFALEEAVGEAAIMAPPSPAPYGLLRTQTRRTQFKGFLVAPPEDGSFVVGDEAGGRTGVHRLVPVTHAERVLAADKDLREAYRRVREAGALTADPVRTCTVDPKRTEHWKKYDAPGLVRILREHLDEVEQRCAQLRQAAAAPAELHGYELETAQVRAYLRVLEAGLPPVLTEDELVASIRSGPIAERVVRLRDALVERAFTSPGALMPGRVRAGVQEFIGFLILTHPEALRLVEAIVQEPILPPAAEGDAAVLRLCTDQMIQLVGLLHPELTRARLSTRVRRAVMEAPQTFDPADEVPFQNHAWACAALTVFKGVHDTGDLDGRVVAQGFRQAIDLCRILELDPSTASPFAKLAKIAQDCAMTMFLSTGVHAKRELDN